MKCHIFVSHSDQIPTWSRLTGLSLDWLLSEYIKAERDGYLCVLEVELTREQYNAVKTSQQLERTGWSFRR